MLKLKNKINRWLCMDDFIPAEQIAELYEVNLNSLKTLPYKDIYGNDKRFKTINGKLYVHKNYQALLKDEVETKYFQALCIAKNDNRLSTELSQILGKKKDTIQRYLIRFTFKQIQIANEILEALTLFIQKNPLLFPLDELMEVDYV